MKMSSMLGARFKETPADCQLDSHKLMIRGGYMKQLTTGIYSLFMPAKRICKKIENIIRDEMDKIDGQEVMFPVVMPASLWQAAMNPSAAKWLVSRTEAVSRLFWA